MRSAEDGSTIPAVTTADIGDLIRVRAAGHVGRRKGKLRPGDIAYVDASDPYIASLLDGFLLVPDEPDESDAGAANDGP